MNCEKCDGKTEVIDSRTAKILFELSIRRRRKCLSCDHRFSTYEITQGQIEGFLTSEEHHEKLQKTLRVLQKTLLAMGISPEDEEPEEQVIECRVDGCANTDINTFRLCPKHYLEEYKTRMYVKKCREAKENNHV